MKDNNAFPEAEHKHDNPVASLDYTHVYKSTIHD